MSAATLLLGRRPRPPLRTLAPHLSSLDEARRAIQRGKALVISSSAERRAQHLELARAFVATTPEPLRAVTCMCWDSDLSEWDRSTGSHALAVSYSSLRTLRRSDARAPRATIIDSPLVTSGRGVIQPFLAAPRVLLIHTLRSTEADREAQGRILAQLAGAQVVEL